MAGKPDQGDPFHTEGSGGLLQKPAGAGEGGCADEDAAATKHVKLRGHRCALSSSRRRASRPRPSVQPRASVLNPDLRNAAVVQARTLSVRMASRCCRRSLRKPRTRGDRSCARRSTGALASSRHKSPAGRWRSHHSVRDGCAQSLGQTECLCVAVSAGCECRGGAREPTGGRSVTIEIFLLCVTPAPPSFRRVRQQLVAKQLHLASL